MVQAVLEGNEHVLGLVVEAVSEVYKFDYGTIQSNPEFENQPVKDVVKGLIPVEDKMVIILDIDQLVSDWIPSLESEKEVA